MDEHVNACDGVVRPLEGLHISHLIGRVLIERIDECVDREN